MKVGIMQPYFVPYIGYWQLMNAVDRYVIYDDVNYINRGWINRNRILIDGSPKYFNVFMIGASQNKLINEIKVDHTPRLVEKNLKTIEYAYGRAPYYQTVYPLIREILYCQKENLASYIKNSFLVICRYLDIQTEFIVSSSLKKDNSLRGEEKIISICELLGANEYYNPIRGTKLYSAEKFKDKGIQLKFIQSNNIFYKQFENEFQPNLSILDVMMFNSKYEIKKMLSKYTVSAC